eukprot:6461383-Amphidinium_carterae.1
MFATPDVSPKIIKSIQKTLSSLQSKEYDFNWDISSVVPVGVLRVNGQGNKHGQNSSLERTSNPRADTRTRTRPDKFLEKTVDKNPEPALNHVQSSSFIAQDDHVLGFFPFRCLSVQKHASRNSNEAFMSNSNIIACLGSEDGLSLPTLGSSHAMVIAQQSPLSLYL